MYTALYRTCRPETFEEILGQEHIVKILKNQVATDSVSHAYLFCGTRGTGKTTTARILAKAVNCLADGERPCGTCPHCAAVKEGNFMDVIEIDAASNNGVENIRELRESVKYPPAMGRKKVYIIDEVHMLSTGAFNALLKTLEEPPEHVMFILATTEPQKLPPTILSRRMRLDFRRVSQKVIAADMARICAERGVSLTEDAAGLLANCADGSVRDGLSILDQVLAGGDKIIDREKVLEYVGTIGEDFFIDLTELVSLKKTAEALVLLNNVLIEGKDVKQIMKDWVSHYRSLLITKFVSNAEDMLNMSTENIRRISEQSRHVGLEEIDFAVTKLSKTINDARWSTNPRVLLELVIVAIAAGENSAPPQPPRRPEAVALIPQPSQPASPVRPHASQPQSVKPETSARTPEPEAQSSRDNDELWCSLFEGVEGGSFNLLRSGAKLQSVSANSFQVLANSDFTKRYAEQKKQELEKMMSDKLGRPMKMICGVETQAAKVTKNNQDAEQLAKEAEKLLGISVDIE